MQLRLLNSLMALSPTLSHPKQSEMHRKKVDFTLLQRRKLLFSNEPIVYDVFSLQNIMKTGLWRTGKGFYGQMKPKSIGLGQMERLISGKKKENHYLTEQHHLLSNMGEEEILWYGVVWGGMEYMSCGIEWLKSGIKFHQRYAKT